MNTVYVETSIVSHACSRPSFDVQLAALQQQAREWWTTQRPRFRLVTSRLTITEAAAGDSSAAERLKMLGGIPLVPIDADVERVANLILSASLMPLKAATDALHVAAAAVSGADYLLTQNCKHIANARVLPGVYRILTDQGYGRLLICTPIEFLDGDRHGDE